MNAHAVRATQVEATFIAGAEANFNAVRGTHLAGSRWVTAHRNEEERVRSVMQSAGQHDREVLRNSPKNECVVMTGSRRRWFFGRRTTSMAIASVLSPVEHYIRSSEAPAPIGWSELVAHVRGLVTDPGVPHLIGVCSPSGFAPQARRGRLDQENIKLVLIEPRDGGGWQVSPAGGNLSVEEIKIFDPEAEPQKLQRVCEEIEARSADLLTGGLSASALSGRLGLPAYLVQLAFRKRADEHSDLRMARRDGDMVLYRGALGNVENRMSMTDRIKQLFSRQGEESRKIDLLSERRAMLAQRRDRIYEDIGTLEHREMDLLTEGRQAASKTGKLRVASQIKTLRDDMERLNTTAKVLGQQIEVISTDIHNLTLIQQGQIAKLPSTEDLTAHAVQAEEMIEQLTAEADLAGTLGAGVMDRLTSQEEIDILRELESPPPQQVKPAGERAPASMPPLREPPQTEPRPREPEAS